MKRYSHILFDHDGVLVDTEPLYYEATRECIAPLGIELDLATYLDLMVDGASAWELARPAVGDAAIERQRACRDVLYQSLLRSRPIDIPDVGAVLARLAQRYPLAIVTTAKQTDFDLIHASRDIVRHMSFVLTRKDYERSKPAPDPYLAALDRFGIGPDQALVVEDSERGLKAAVAAGIDCAVVDHPFTATQDFSSATWRLPNLAALADRMLGQK